MTTLPCELHTITKIDPVPDSDRLGSVRIYDFPVIVNRDDIKEGDRVIYFPVDAIVPDHPALRFLWPTTTDPTERDRRIRARKFRGAKSEGLVVPAALFAKELGAVWVFEPDGSNVADRLGVTKWLSPDEKAEMRTAARCAAKRRIPWWARLLPDTIRRVLRLYPRPVKCPAGFIRYTGIEQLRKHKNLFQDDDVVCVTEKLHGSNARYAYLDGKFWVGSRNVVLDPASDNVWTRAASAHGLETRCKRYPGYVFFGEIIGSTQRRDGYDYGYRDDFFFLFDIYDSINKVFLNPSQIWTVADKVGLHCSPTLCTGRWGSVKSNIESLADSVSVIAVGKAAQLRAEGVVIRPFVEREVEHFGRLILKMHGHTFLRRKEGK